MHQQYPLSNIMLRLEVYSVCTELASDAAEVVEFQYAAFLFFLKKKKSDENITIL